MMKFSLRICLLPTMLLTCLLAGCAPEGEGGLEGRLLFQDKPLAAAQVEIYLRAVKDRSVQPFAVATTDAKGSYRVTLPEGRYFVIGKKRETTTDGRTRMLMGESPGNPHDVTRGVSRIAGFNLREMGREKLAAADARLSGRVTHQGKGIARAFVYIYTATEGELMGPSYGEAVQTDADGGFSVELPAGHYSLVARMRADGGRSGELVPGDLNGVYPSNPVALQSGDHLQLADLPLTVVDAEKHAMRQAQGVFTPTDTQLAGSVVDAEGRPVSGVYVFAYLDSRMVGKPVHIAPPTDASGAYRIYVADGGTYFVGARSAYGGPLEPGEWVGTYDGRADHSVTVDRGAVVDLGKITVREVW